MKSQNSPWRHLPNILSALRIALIPVIVWLSLGNMPMLALIAFGAGALTDLLDGVLARRCHWHSRVGEILDPIADKLFVLCLMPLLWHYGAISGLFAALITARFSLQLSVFPVLIGWLKRPYKVIPHITPKLATAVAYLVLGLGFLQQVAIDRLPDVSAIGNYLDKTIGAASFIGILLEIWVLATFAPRYWQIIRNRHDTFG